LNSAGIHAVAGIGSWLLCNMHARQQLKLHYFYNMTFNKEHAYQAITQLNQRIAFTNKKINAQVYKYSLSEEEIKIVEGD